MTFEFGVSFRSRDDAKQFLSVAMAKTTARILEDEIGARFLDIAPGIAAAKGIISGVRDGGRTVREDAAYKDAFYFEAPEGEEFPLRAVAGNSHPAAEWLENGLSGGEVITPTSPLNAKGKPSMLQFPKQASRYGNASYTAPYRYAPSVIKGGTPAFKVVRDAMTEAIALSRRR